MAAMGWSADSAVAAYLDTVKLCKLHQERRSGPAGLPTETEPQSTEFVSALAAGMKAQLIVEVCSGAAPFSIALAAAARQTGGRLVCILPAGKRCSESMRAVRELGLEDVVEFVTGHADQLLPQYNNVDFALIDCTHQREPGLFEVLKLSPGGAVVVAHNLLDRNVSAAYARAFRRRAGVKSISLPIGKGIEVTRISAVTDAQKTRFDGKRSRWIFAIDERTGEEHVFRIPKPIADALQEQEQ